MLILNIYVTPHTFMKCVHEHLIWCLQQVCEVGGAVEPQDTGKEATD